MAKPLARPQLHQTRTTTVAKVPVVEEDGGLLAGLEGVHDLRAGHQLSHYTLVDRLGMGGMGEVWRAKDNELDREVALKVLLKQTRRGLTRFAREAQMVAALDHPHLARVYDFTPQSACLAMQLIEGQPIEGAGASSLVALRDAALGIHHAHQRGVLHRDVKPGNILVDADGKAYVVDFGLACAVDRGSTSKAELTISGEILGTPAFMAPEQARADSADITVRTDVYGLGATLHCLLRDGEPPFDGATPFDIVDAVLEDEPPPTHGNRDLETIALKAMSKAPARRYATAEEFAADLDRFLNHEPILARRPSMFYILGQSIRRRPSIWALAVALVLAVAIGGGFGAAKAFEAAARTDEVQQQREDLIAERERLLEARRDLLDRERAATDADRRALDSATEALAEQNRAQAAREEKTRALRFQGMVELERRLLLELADRSARRIDIGDLEALYADLQDQLERLMAIRADWPVEGVIDVLIGEAQFLKQDDAAAMASFARALEHADGDLSQQSAVTEQALVGRARARVRSRFQDHYARRALLGSGFDEVLTEDRLAVQQDIERAQQSDADSFDFGVLRLWSRFLDEQEDPSADLVRAVADEVAAGGRRGESALALQGIVDLARSRRDPDALFRALEAFDQSVHRAWVQPQIWLLRGLTHRRLGRPADAVADATEAIEQRRGYALAHLLRGLCFRDLDKPREARADLERVVDLLAHEPMAWYHRGLLNRSLGAHQAAADDLHEAIRVAQLDPDFRAYDRLWQAYGDVFTTAGLTEQALIAYKQAADYGSISAALAEIRVLIRTDRTAEVEQRFVDILGQVTGASSISRTDVLVQRSDFLEQQNRRREALQDLAEVARYQPRDPRLLLRRGRIQARQGQRPRALLDLDAGVAWLEDQLALAAADGHLPDAYRQLGAELLLARAHVLRASRQWERAKRDLSAAEDLAAATQLPIILVQQASLDRSVGQAEAATTKRQRAEVLWRQLIRSAEKRHELVEMVDLIDRARQVLEDPRFGSADLERLIETRRRMQPHLRSLWSRGIK